MPEPEYTIQPARYAKNMMVIHCKPNRLGWMTTAERIACVLSSHRYSHRERAYLMSKHRATAFQTLLNAGWGANPITATLIGPHGSEWSSSQISKALATVNSPEKHR